MTNQRLIHINDGIAMVLTDLHGAGEIYFNLRDRFLALRARGEVDRLIICGDLIHSEGPAEEDASLEMLFDVMRLQAELGADVVTMLLGNHEMPHIYAITLTKGEIEYTPRFEAALAKLETMPDPPFTRPQVINFLESLPFYAATKAGVLLTHAGAPWNMQTMNDLRLLLNFDHDALIAKAQRKLNEYDLATLRQSYADAMDKSYDQLVRYYLGVTNPDNPRYNDLLNAYFINTKDAAFALLWDALFTQNERGGSANSYEWVLTVFLNLISEACQHEQRMLVAGHIAVKNGYEIIAKQQLRMATYAHAKPTHTGRYLLLDCERPVENINQLEMSLRTVFADAFDLDDDDD